MTNNTLPETGAELLTLPGMARALRVVSAVRAESRFLFSRAAVERALLERAEQAEVAR